MKKPTQMQAFDALYAIAAGDGRGEALFGNSIELARPAYERTLLGNAYPAAYIEFPLLGEPGFDLLSVYGSVEPGSRFAVGAGFGYQPMIDWYAAVRNSSAKVSCGIELDTSTGETERAGVYLQQHHHRELVAPFLASVGEGGRAESYLRVLNRMPAGWAAEYVGLFPGRAGTPMRIGGYMGYDEHMRCAEDPKLLRKRFEQIGFTAFDAPMLDFCADFMRIAPSVDFQFDIMPDGSLSDVFGLSLSLNETKPREARECMESGYGAQLMTKLEAQGLADDRWKLIADAAFARHVGFERADGSEGRFALAIKFNYAKVKFKGGVLQPAKFYFVCVAGEVEA